MTIAHIVEDEPNILGEEVYRVFTKRVIDGEMYVHEKKIVGLWGAVTDEFFMLDTEGGRDRLAKDCISPDMLPEE